MPSCLRCQSALPARSAFICGNVGGDEYIESYFACASCGRFTVEVYRDRFDGTDSVTCNGPMEVPEAQGRMALIARCETPGDKHCRCAAHLEYFRF